MTTVINTLPALRTLEALCLEIHARLEIDNAPFDLATLAHEMCDAHMILADVDLSLYTLGLITAMVNHPKRRISGAMAMAIYGHLQAMQALIMQTTR